MKIPVNVTVDVVEAARFMGCFSMTLGVLIDDDLDIGLCWVALDGPSDTGLSAGKLSYND